MTDMKSRLAALTAEPSRDTPNDVRRLERVERTRVEMAGQGAAIARTFEQEAAALTAIGKRLQGRAVDRVVIAGCGDSWFAGMAVRTAIETIAGIPVEAVQALDFARYGADVCTSRSLVIGISSGGNTPAVLEALSAAQERNAFTVGVSNTVGSPILTRFDAALVVRADRKGWPTQSTNATMALLVALGGEIVEPRPGSKRILEELRVLPATIDAVCRDLDAPVKALAERWSAAGLVLFAGLGPNFAAAAIGAAKLRELSPTHAFALPLEEYHHYRTQKAGDPLVLVATDAASRERALDTALVAQHVGGPVVALLCEDAPEIESRVDAVLRLPAVHPALSAMVSIVPLHLLAYHFATMRARRGLGAPRLSLVG